MPAHKLFCQDLPCSVKIPAGSFTVGSAVVVTGRIPKDISEAGTVTNRFRIQIGELLEEETLPQTNCDLQYNPRFDSEGHTICNTKVDGHWQTEQKFQNYLTPGNSLKVTILCKEEGYRIRSGGKTTLYNYTRTIPLERINVATVDGNFCMKSIRVISPTNEEGYSSGDDSDYHV